MPYEVTTPVLVEAIEVARAVIRGIQAGELEPREAAQINAAGRLMVAGVRDDVRARLNQARIAAYEAKQIEGSDNKAIERGLPRK